MLLERLSEYADQIVLPPMMYREQPVRYVIQLDHDGRYLRMIDRASVKEKRGPEMLAPDRKRAYAIKPKLLTDNAEYVLGIEREGGKPERVQAAHRAFVELTQRCASETGESSLAAVVTFLAGQHAANLPPPDEFDPSATITFEVDSVRPIDLPLVQRFWAKEASTADEDEPAMECLVCGNLRPPVVPLPIPVKGIPGGNQSGTALISANANAFESYGLENVRISPICEPCGLRLGYALNALLNTETTHVREGGNKYIFWAREPAPFSVATLLSRADEADVRRFLTAAWRSHPEAARLDVTPFYAATLSGNNARVVVRDWVETTLGEVQRHLQRYFALQRLVDRDGNDRWFALLTLARATVNAKSRQEDPAPQVGQALLRLALHGDPLPEWLLYQAVRRTRAEQKVTAPHAALIKMVLLTQASEEGRSGDMAELDVRNRDQAYLCGRLLAELEAVQRAALGDVGAGVVDRYFGTASSAPASVFGRLLRGAQPHLMKLRKERPGAYMRLDERLQEILSDLHEFPPTLTLKKQGMFVLGYYHQKAADIRAARARKAAKGAPPDDVNEHNAESDE